MAVPGQTAGRATVAASIDSASTVGDPLELVVRDDERRPEQDRVAVDAVGACRSPSRAGRRARGRPATTASVDPVGARERRPGLPVGDELDADQQAAAADLADGRVVAERRPRRSARSRSPFDGAGLDERLRLEDAQDLAGDGRADRRVRVGEAVDEPAGAPVTAA